MESTRRDFLGRATTGAIMLTGLPLAIASTARSAEGAELRPGGALQGGSEFDTTWPARITNKHKAVFDCSEIESGYGVWRAFAWAGQYQQHLGVQPSDLSPVIILRHNAIALAMNQAYWDKYGIGKAKNVTHPLTLEPTTRNPALLSGEADGVPAPFDQAALQKQMSRGVIVLACNLAFADCVDLVGRMDKLGPEEARARALTYVVPGVIMQPSGVFAAVRAQEAGCTYVKAA